MLLSHDPDRPWWKSPLIYLAVACVAFIALFAHFASEVMGRDTGTFDKAVRDWTMARQSPAVLAVFRVFTQIGRPLTLALAAVIVSWVLVRRGARKRPLIVAVAPFLFSVFVAWLKDWYEVERPPAGLATALTFSFPSGHTSNGTAVAIVIGYVLARERVAPRLGWAIALVIPIALGVSRVYLDRHWASDVIGGWMIGSAYAAAVCALYERAHGRAVAKR